MILLCKKTSIIFCVPLKTIKPLLTKKTQMQLDKTLKKAADKNAGIDNPLSVKMFF